MAFKIVFLVYPKLTQLDFSAPAQLLAMAGATVETAWKTREPIETDSGFAIVPSTTLKDCRQADVICIPGGVGCHDMMDDDEVLCWIRHVAGDAKYVTSVCTGSLILAAAGLLEGRRATSHWLWRRYLDLFGAIPTDARIVVDGNRITGGGVTAGLDFGLALLEALVGRVPAELAQLGAEYDPHPPLNAGSPKAAGPALVSRLEELAAKQIAWRVERIRKAAQRLGHDPLVCPPPPALI
jgi:cyclohexyl-isocyanide hydratase